MPPPPAPDAPPDDPPRRHWLARVGALGAATLAGAWGGARADTATNTNTNTNTTTDRDRGAASLADPDGAAALHALNRLAFGPRPGDVDRVRQMGVDAWIAEQLQPQRLPLPATLQAALDGLGATQHSARQLVQDYRQGQQAAKQGEDARLAQRQRLRQLQLETGEDRLLRALHSPRQLEEVLVDFWFNHFNVFNGKGLVRVLVDDYEQRAIRPHVLGRFRDLLGATARHPAMLVYLDNALSVGPGTPAPRHRRAAAAATPPKPAKPQGLNENYARELMELHTLGVDGGYTQADVTALARVFTGWTLSPRSGGEQLFAFEAARHDDGPKTWLGRAVPDQGQAQGEWALDVLAVHPATARHLSFQLARHFVADAPPAGLVDALARTWLATGGDLRAVMQALLASPAFRDPAVRGQRFKTPYRYVLSAVRATGLPVADVRPLLAAMAQLGQPLHACPTPDGWKDTEADWLNPEAISRRINFATALASGRLPLAEAPGTDAAGGGRRALTRNAQRQSDRALAGAATATDADAGLPAAAGAVDAAALRATLAPGLSARTQAAATASAPALQAALLLGSPDFMRH